jgi:fluoroquinolone transport system permease protein
MNALGLLRTLGPVDLRNVRRDPILGGALVLPFFVALLFRLGVPPLASWLDRRHGFDLATYYPLLVGGYFMVVPSVVGFISGFLLLDERDDRVLDAMRVTPVSMPSLLAYRLGVPLALGLVMTLLGYPIIGLVVLTPAPLLAAAALAAFGGPVLALFLVAFAEDKVSGFALAKLFGAVSDLPLFAWFLPMPWQLVAGLLPTYWPMKMVWQASVGAPWTVYALVGLVVNVLAVALLLRRFRRVLER